MESNELDYAGFWPRAGAQAVRQLRVAAPKGLNVSDEIVPPDCTWRETARR